MSYNSGGSMHKRPLDNSPYQGSGGFQSGSADTKRSRPEMGVGGGIGANNLSVYGPPGGNGPRSMIPTAGSSAGDYPGRPGMEAGMYFRRAGNSKFGQNCRYDHLVDGPPSPNRKGDFRGVPGCGRGATDRSATFDGPPQHQQQATQSGESQNQKTPGSQNQHGHIQQPSPQQASSSQQTFNQQPPLQQPQQVPQQGASAQFKEGQSNPPGTSNTTSVDGFNGGAYIGGYVNNAGAAAVISPSSTSMGHVAVRASNCAATSGTGSSLSANNRAPGAAFRSTPGGSGSVPHSAPPAYEDTSQMQRTTGYRLSAPQHSGGTPVSSASGTASSTNVTSTAGWVFDPSTGGYKVSSGTTTATSNVASSAGTTGNGKASANGNSQQQGYRTSPQQHQGPSTGSTAAGPSSTNAHAPGFNATQHNVLGASGPPGVPRYEATTGGNSDEHSRTGTSTGGSTSASHSNLYGQSQSPVSGPSAGYDGNSERRAYGSSGSVGTSASSGGYVVPTASGTYGSSPAGAQGSTPTTSGQSNYGLTPGTAPSSAKTTNYAPGVQQPAYQSVATPSGYGNVASGGFSVSSYSQQNHASHPGYQRPGHQQEGIYGREGSSNTASSAGNGNTPSATSSPRREKTSTSDNMSRGETGVAVSSTSTSSAIGPGGTTGTGGGSRASSREESETSGVSNVGAISSTATIANESTSAGRDVSAPKQPVTSVPTTYPAQQVALASGSPGNKEATQGASCGAAPKVSSEPTSILQQQPVTPPTGGGNGFLVKGPLMGSIMGYGIPPQGVQYPMPAIVQSSNGPQQQQYVQGTSSVSAPASNSYGAPVAQPQQPVPQQQQQTATGGQYIMTPQGQAQPYMQQQTWKQPQQTSIQQQPLQTQPPPQGQPGVGQQPHPSVTYSGFLSGLPSPGIPTHAPQQQSGYNPATAPFVQQIQQQPPQQHQALPQQSPSSGFNGPPGPAGVFQANGQPPHPQSAPGGNLIFNHGGAGNGNIASQVIRNSPGANLAPQGMVPSQGERGGREGRGRDGRDDIRDGRHCREGNRYSPSNPAPNMPQRPSQPECNHFIKTGFCRYGTTCKYHHPYHKVGRQPMAEANGDPRNPNMVQQQDRAPCDVYLDTGVCTFGDKCRFRHISRGQLAMESAQGVTHPNPHQLPHRAGLPPCGFYARTGKCAFGMKCKFDHPQHRNPNMSGSSNSSKAGACASSGFEPGGGSSETHSGSSHRQHNTGAGPVGRVQRPNSPTLKSDQKDGPTEVTARHILIKHKGSRRPASWQDPSGSAIKQRTQAQATAILHSLRVGIKTEDDFAKVAMAKSDCSSAKRGGDLSSFGRGKMQRAFEDAAFGLEVGGVSEVVATDSGVHLIMRTA